MWRPVYQAAAAAPKAMASCLRLRVSCRTMARTRERSLLLPTVLGIVVLALVVLGTVLYRSSFELDHLRERSVVEATLSVANEKADRLEKSIIEQDNALVDLTFGENIERFGQRWLSVPVSQTPSVRAALLIDISLPSHEVLAFASRAPGPDDDSFRRLLFGQFWSKLDLAPAAPGALGLKHLHTSVGESNYLISYLVRATSQGLELLVLWHDVPRIVHDLFPRLYSAEAGPPSRVNVVDAHGRIVYGPPLGHGALTLGRQFATTLYKWRVNVSMSAAETLASEVEQRRLLEMALVGASSVVVLVGLLVSAIAAFRERKLAELKSEFVANVSHELKTPLSLVRMFSEMLLSGRAPADKQKQYLEIIVTESERLTALIDNVLDFARVDRGEGSFALASTPLAETLARAVDICRPRAERQGVVLELSLPEGSTDTLVDERAVEIAVINLIDNALKYAPRSQAVRIALLRDVRYFSIVVEDDGPGIPVGQRKRIFERFVRGVQEAGQAQRGSGIGLSLVAQIAQAHGGRAWVEEAKWARGARFVMTLRATTADSAR
jgi:two-component system, OmpR family, phosphate regulon sensor histidine kinase PhoR